MAKRGLKFGQRSLKIVNWGANRLAQASLGPLIRNALRRTSWNQLRKTTRQLAKSSKRETIQPWGISWELQIVSKIQTLAVTIANRVLTFRAFCLQLRDRVLHLAPATRARPVFLAARQAPTRNLSKSWAWRALSQWRTMGRGKSALSCQPTSRRASCSETHTWRMLKWAKWLTTLHAMPWQTWNENNNNLQNWFWLVWKPELAKMWYIFLKERFGSLWKDFWLFLKKISNER